MTPIPPTPPSPSPPRPTLPESGTSFIWSRAIVVHSEALPGRQAPPERARRPSVRDPLPFQKHLGKLFSFHVDATLQRVAQMSVKSF